MSDLLSDTQWDFIVRRIQGGKVTPFIGAGASAGSIKTAAALAKEWAAKFNYPIRDDCEDLARVAQFLAIEVDEIEPKDVFAAICDSADRPDFSNPNQIHASLARLPFPVYITTNYDDFMFEALQKTLFTKASGETIYKSPRLEYCRWNDFMRDVREHAAKPSPPPPTEGEPLVFHLHGHHSQPQSMVLTEDDYLSFLAWMAANPQPSSKFLPEPITTALVDTSLLFVGYSHRDWTFRVLFRAIVERLTGGQRRRSISVQLPPDGTTPEERDKVVKYLNKYYEKQNRIPMHIYWGDASQFAEELRQKWEHRHGGRTAGN